MNGYEKRTILLVEDELLIAGATADTLRSFGYEVVTAHSGEEGVRLALADPAVSLVLMDIDLGSGIDGTEAARQILAGRELPIVFHTAHSERPVVDKVKGITRYGYVIKNSGDFVLESSIEMAFELFEAHSRTRLSEERYRRLHDTMMDSFLSVTLNGTIIATNPSFRAMIGYTEEELQGMTYLDISPEQWHYLGKKLLHEQLLVRGFTDIYEKEYRRKDGTVFPVEVRTFLIRDRAGNPEMIWAIVRDISERKQFERALLERTSMLDDILESQPGGVYRLCVTDRDNWREGGDSLYAYEFISDHYCELTGTTREELLATPGLTLRQVHPDDYEKFIELNIRSVRDRVPFSWDVRMIVRGEVRWIHYESRLKRTEPRGDIWTGVILDVTDRHRVEDQLRESEERLSDLLENVPIGMFQSTPGGKLLYANRSMASIFGYDAVPEFMATVNATSIGEAFFEKPERREHLVAQLGQGKVEWRVFENRYRHRNGRVLDTIVTVCARRDSTTGEPVLFGFLQDITERRLAYRALGKKNLELESLNEELNAALEELEAANRELRDGRVELEESEAMYRSLFEQAAVGVAQIDATSGRFCRINQKYCDLLGYSAAEMLAVDFQSITHPDDRESNLALLDRVSRGEVKEYSLEKRYLHKNGSVVWVNLTVSQMWLPRRDPHYHIAIAYDITERKRVEGEIGRLLEEKELILKEVHHRIKNNMITISSLLSLQAATLGDTEAARVLQEARGRIHSMIIIYDKLFRSSEFRKTSVRVYLAALVDEIAKTWFGNAPVMIEKQIDDIVLEVKLFMPVGIIINELITNSFKYAFPERREGKVTVSLTKAPGDLVELRIGDDGIGMPADFDIGKPAGFGIHLVRLLTQQLGGTLELLRGTGTTFVITFKP